MQDWQYGKKLIYPRGVLLGIIGGGVLPGSPNPDPISDQKVSEKMECPILFSVPSAPPPPLHFLFFSAAADLNKNHSASASSFTSKHERSRKQSLHI